MTRPYEGTRRHEAEVGARFDLLHARFKREVPAEDVRLRAILEALGPVEGRRVLDLGCGKGRFASRLEEAGARVVGLDLSAAMLAGCAGLDRVRASARRLPFPRGAFDAVVAVEVFEHLAGVDDALGEARRVLRPGGVLAVVDKNAGSWNAQRPWLPNLAVKWIDEKRGRWMYPSGGPVRERWFWPGAFRARLARTFGEVRVEHLLSPAEGGIGLFRHLPSARLLTLWTARAPGDDRP
jgi:SAM-dependent methyltransferase